MIFPDEKMTNNAFWDWVPQTDVEQKSLLLSDCFVAGSAWVINHIKSAASDGFEEFWAKVVVDPENNDVTKGFHRSTYGAAVISTAAKYEEKLERKVNALRNEERIRQDYVERTVKLQDENEQLKAEIERAKRHADGEERVRLMYVDRLAKSQDENEQLKAALRFAINSLETACELMDEDEDDVTEMRAWCQENKKLLTKINKGE